eukprot:scaffold3275_cov385-Prasinococcus_capsulatus_cf.AAC.7
MRYGKDRPVRRRRASRRRTREGTPKRLAAQAERPAGPSSLLRPGAPPPLGLPGPFSILHNLVWCAGVLQQVLPTSPGASTRLVPRADGAAAGPASIYWPSCGAALGGSFDRPNVPTGGSLATGGREGCLEGRTDGARGAFLPRHRELGPHSTVVHHDHHHDDHHDEHVHYYSVRNPIAIIPE